VINLKSWRGFLASELASQGMVSRANGDGGKIGTQDRGVDSESNCANAVSSLRLLLAARGH
jgi:hypothetical protein